MNDTRRWVIVVLVVVLAIGLIAFAGRSYILSPLTVDGGAVNMYLDALDPDIASEGGTALGAMLRQGGELLSANKDGADRVLVVFTDGEGHDTKEDALTAARTLARDGITLVLVAEGGTEPVRIPIRDPNGTLIEYKLDENGEVVRTRRDDETLREVEKLMRASLAAAEKLVSDHPDVERYRKSLGWAQGHLGMVQYRAGDWRAATASLEKCFELAGDDHEATDCQFFLAMAYWRLGDKERAGKSYDRAVRWTTRFRRSASSPSSAGKRQKMQPAGFSARMNSIRQGAQRGFSTGSS